MLDPGSHENEAESIQNQNPSSPIHLADKGRIEVIWQRGCYGIAPCLPRTM